MLKRTLVASALISGAMLCSPAIASDQLPDPFKQYQWLLDGARKVKEMDREFAPVTSCYDLNEKFVGESSTSIQKKREWEKYKGKIMPLTGIVEEVKEIPLVSGYVAFFKCTNSKSLIVDFTMQIPKEMEEYAFELTPGDKRKVHVRLTDYGEIMGVDTEMDTFKTALNNGENCHAYLDWMDRKTGAYEYKCYNLDVRTGIGRGHAKNEIAHYIGGIETDKEKLGFSINEENTDIYILYATNKKTEQETIYLSGNESCTLTKKEIMEMSKDANDSRKEITAAIKSSFLEAGDINKWAEGEHQRISNINNSDISCKEKQYSRYIIHSFYQVSREEGMEKTKEMIEESGQ